MAETVKKSRIVSDKADDVTTMATNNNGGAAGSGNHGNDDDLEGSLMEEFNMRLKSCMSQDDLHGDCDEDEQQPQQTNGFHGDGEQKQLNNVAISITSSENFIRAEQEFSKETCDVESKQQKEEESLKSIKDRMLLSTDSSCLLFTQTVTSPMLTPSEEHVDFLKSFEKSAEEQSPNEENQYENTTFSQSKVEENKEETSPVYENLDPKQQTIEDQEDQNLYENVNKDGVPLVTCAELDEEQENIYENLPQENRVGLADDEPDQVIYENVESVISDSVNVNDDSKNVENAEEEANNIAINTIETDDSTQQVSSESSYVETTTFESSNVASSDDVTRQQQQVLKKKKTKKTRKEEKENISVNGTTNNLNNCALSDVNTTNVNNNKNNSNNGNLITEESTTTTQHYYNVDVKNLCRSFGDLSRFEDTVTNNNHNLNNHQHATTPNSPKIAGIDRTISEQRTTKSSFSKFDALQKKNVLHVRSSDSSKAQEKFNDAAQQSEISSSNCRSCEKPVFEMEKIKAEKAIWHKNCFRCNECNKQLNVDTYESHEGTLYCKPHFKALFAPKAVEDDPKPKSRKPELIIRENQPLELPPDVVRASDKPDLGLEELQALNVKERFQVFEHFQDQSGGGGDLEKSPVNVKRSASILSKLARFQSKGMDIGVSDEALNGIPVEASSESEPEQSDPEVEGEEDADLIRARRVQKEKPFHFTGMSDVKNKWEQQGEQQIARDERREERKQEIQSIRSRLFMGKQGKMKEAYQQAIMESETSVGGHVQKEKIEVADTKSIKERFEKGEVVNSKEQTERERTEEDDSEVYESEISKKSRSLFQELDANASKPPQVAAPVPKLDVRKARENYLSKTASDQEVIKSSDDLNSGEIVEIRTADIQQKFKFFETYQEPEKERKTFRITPPREGQVKAPTPERQVYRDPDIIRSEDLNAVNGEQDSLVAVQSHTATKMLSKFRQMEEEVTRGGDSPQGLKPLKRFTPPPEEPGKHQGQSTEEEESEEDGEEEEEEDEEEVRRQNSQMYRDEDLLEAQKAARAKQLRAKFERWEANEIKREQNNSSVNIIEEIGEDQQSQIESTKTIRARFESMRQTTQEGNNRSPRVKVNRFVELVKMQAELCSICGDRVYPLEKIAVHNHVYHKNCFKCMECSCVLRMDSYSYNQGQLYCTPHFKRLFISKGNYDTGFGFGQHKEKWNSNHSNANNNASSAPPSVA